MKNLLKPIIIVLALTLSLSASTGFPKEYYKLQSPASKAYFFNFLESKIENANLKILEERKFILSLDKKTNLDENSPEYKKLLALQKKYKIKKLYNYKNYLQRIDIVPPSQAFAQAATESGWGRSRFVKVANNIFGHWTRNPNNGVVPLRREAGKKHLVRKFSSLQASIEAYMLNLNRTGAYSQFRLQREVMRANNQVIDGLKLSQTMINYSGIGKEYLRILKSIIKTNKLQKYDKKFHNKIKDDK